MSKTILITGATGLIGGYLIREILSRGHNYIALTTNPEAAAKKLAGAKKILGFNEVLSLQNEKTDGIINLAGSNLCARRWSSSAKK